MTEILERLERGRGRAADLDLLADLADNILGRSFCPLGDAAAMPVQGFLKHFRAEFEHHVEQQRCLANRRRDVAHGGAGMSAQCRVTIDGRTVEVPAGTLVTDAARAAEVHIPVFCSHSKLPPLGACRICLVEIGLPKRTATGKPVLGADGGPRSPGTPSPRPAAPRR